MHFYSFIPIWPILDILEFVSSQGHINKEKGDDVLVSFAWILQAWAMCK